MTGEHSAAESPPVTVVSGGGTGIGAAIATRAASTGHTVVICGRRLESLQQVEAPIGSRGTIEAVTADVTSEEDVDRLVRTVLERHGRIDHVVANAGIMRSGTVLDTTPQEWQEILTGNVTSAYLLARTALPHLLETRGTLVGVASIAALRASAGAAAYATSKAAMVMLFRSIAVDFAPQGIRANVVCPGWVRTEMADEEMREFGAAVGLNTEAAYTEMSRLVPQRRVAEPDEVAAAAMWLLGREASYVNGAVLTVDGGTTIVDPGTVPFDHALTPREH
jgi:NAD(P)-dependent dehydrogenase (short-subunit alcohol dehydrogenase family)